MCGINGILNLKPDNAFLEESSLKKMNSALAHRGPDDSGIWISPKKNVALAQTRLSIIDLSPLGHQPMKDPANDSVIVFNGEIFNFKSINSTILKEENFVSASDTETLLKLYSKFGEEMFSYINGMFAFALWDKSKERLLLARDRSGKKPLYYTIYKDKFAFSSEIKALLTLEDFTREVDKSALYDFFTFGLSPSESTLFKNIKKLSPGHTLTIDVYGNIKITRYWEPKISNFSGLSTAEFSYKVREQLRKSVELRMVSDVPVGAFLSGGVDSSAVVAFMREQSESEIKTFSIGFKDMPQYDETQYANRVSKIFGTKHYTKIVTKKDVVDFMPKVADIFDDPLADTTLVPINFISQIAHEEGIKVVLTGDGADELFAGYDKYRKYASIEPIYRAWSSMPKIIKQSVSNGVNRISDNSVLGEFFRRSSSNVPLYWGHSGGMRESLKSKILSKEFIESAGTLNSEQIITSLYSDFQNLDSARKLDFTDWLCYVGFRIADTELYLMRSDRLAMAHSVETRAPFLDYEMVELALSITGEYKIQKGVSKWILKEALNGILPHEILYRKKRGFNLPFREWAAESYLKEVKNSIEEFNSKVHWFNLDVIFEELLAAESGNSNSQYNMWIIYTLMLWYRKWIEQG